MLDATILHNDKINFAENFFYNLFLQICELQSVEIEHQFDRLQFANHLCYC